MSVNLNIVDRGLLKKALKDMSSPERELTKLRVREVAKAVSSVSPDFKRLVALQMLEEDGLISEGSVDRASSASEHRTVRKSDQTDHSDQTVSSVFAQMRPGRNHE